MEYKYLKATFKGIFSRSYYGYGNLLSHETIPTCSAMIVFNRSYYGYGDLLSHENDTELHVQR